MSVWQEEYYPALGVRDEREKANISFYNTYTRLADRAGKLCPRRPVPDLGQAHPSAMPIAMRRKPGMSDGQILPPREILELEETESKLDAVHKDIAKIERSRKKLLERLEILNEETQTVEKYTLEDNQRELNLTTERAQLLEDIKDRDNELENQGKILENIQEKQMSAIMRCEMSNDRTRQYEDKNKKLIDRWMDEKRKEAEAMNKEFNS